MEEKPSAEAVWRKLHGPRHARSQSVVSLLKPRVSPGNTDRAKPHYHHHDYCIVDGFLYVRSFLFRVADYIEVGGRVDLYKKKDTPIEFHRISLDLGPANPTILGLSSSTHLVESFNFCRCIHRPNSS